jgi:hypothetical protein
VSVTTKSLDSEAQRLSDHTRPAKATQRNVARVRGALIVRGSERDRHAASHTKDESIW